MLNQVVLVGRLVADISAKKPNLIINCPLIENKGTKDNIIEIELGENTIKCALEYLKKDDIVGVKGKLVKKYNKLVINCEKLTFLQKNESKEKEQ